MAKCNLCGAESCAHGFNCVSRALEQRDRDLARLRSALTSLEQAYSNPHSPQHRAACLAEARAVLQRS